MKINENIEITNEDNMLLMARYPDGYFDLAIVDPPYGIEINMNMGRKKGQEKKHNEKDWDNRIPDEKYFNELKRVSKNQIIFGGNYFPLPSTKSWIFWDKNVPKGVSFADGELAWTSFDKTLVKIAVTYTGFKGMDENGKIHPTQKPVKLYENLFTKYAESGYKILDTHLGSGSIAIALDNVNKIEKMNLTLTACELDTEYYESSIRRIIEKTNWQSLF